MAGLAADRRPRQQERRAERSAITDPAIVLAAAAALLAIRSRTTHELRVRLVTLGYPAGMVDTTVERMVALRYLDDDAYARAWVAGRDRARPRGATALRQELLRKGLDRELVDAALAEREGHQRQDRDDGGVVDPDAQPLGGDLSADHAAALRLLDRRRSSLIREPDARKRQQRAYALLARNGFDPGVCRDATRTFMLSMDDMAPGQV